MLKKSKVFSGILTILSFIFFSMTVYSQKGDSKALEVLEKLQERYEESIEGIDDYVMEKGQHTIYYKKAYDDGRPYFKVKTENAGRMESATAGNKDLYSQLSGQVKEKATYEGTDEVDGHHVHILHVNELEIDNLNDDPNVDNTIEDLYLYIDPGKWVIRQMEYTVEFTDENGEVREVSPVIQNRDFRDVEGMKIPYETSTTITGLTLTEEEHKEAEEGLEKFEEDLQEMPEAQRKMAKQMMGDRIKKYRKMIDENEYKSVTKVKEVRVNTGMEDF